MSGKGRRDRVGTRRVVHSERGLVDLDPFHAIGRGRAARRPVHTLHHLVVLVVLFRPPLQVLYSKWPAKVFQQRLEHVNVHGSRRLAFQAEHSVLLLRERALDVLLDPTDMVIVLVRRRAPLGWRCRGTGHGGCRGSPAHSLAGARRRLRRGTDLPQRRPGYDLVSAPPFGPVGNKPLHEFALPNAGRAVPHRRRTRVQAQWQLGVRPLRRLRAPPVLRRKLGLGGPMCPCCVDELLHLVAQLGVEQARVRVRVAGVVARRARCRLDAGVPRRAGGAGARHERAVRAVPVRRAGDALRALALHGRIHELGEVGPVAGVPAVEGVRVDVLGVPGGERR